MDEGHSGSLLAGREASSFFRVLPVFDRESGFLAGLEGVLDRGSD